MCLFIFAICTLLRILSFAALKKKTHRQKSNTSNTCFKSYGEYLKKFYLSEYF